MFKFLKLHSSSYGDARRHVPFTSIIHKHIFPVFFVTILFLTLFFRPYSAEALAQLVPEIQPVYDTTIESLYEFIKVQLDDTHKQVFDLLLGSYMVGYAGMSDYKLSYSYNSDTPIKEWLINSGVDLYNTILSLGGLSVSSGSNYLGVPKIGAKELSPLLQTAMGCALKAKTYNNADDAYNDITSSDSYPIPLTVDIMYSINAAMGYYGGLYNWQFTPASWLTNQPTWTSPNASGTNLIQYQDYVQTFSNPVLANAVGANGYEVSGLVFDFNTNKYDLFINTSSYYVGFVDSSGNFLSSLGTFPAAYIWVWDNRLHKANLNVSANYVSYSNGNFNNYSEIASYYLNTFMHYGVLFESSSISGNSWGVLYPSEYFSGNVYFGSNWNNKTLLDNNTDLNLDLPSQPTFLKGVENGLLDLKGLLEDILGTLELKPPVINNYYYPDGDPVPEADIEPAMQNNTLPDSGVDIDQNLFAPLFSSEGKKSYISYLWYMTKPLVLYTKDLFSCLVFDPVADFAASGPGYFVYGVVGLGLISGLLVKCLL